MVIRVLFSLHVHKVQNVSHTITLACFGCFNLDGDLDMSVVLSISDDDRVSSLLTSRGVVVLVTRCGDCAVDLSTADAVDVDIFCRWDAVETKRVHVSYGHRRSSNMRKNEHDYFFVFLSSPRKIFDVSCEIDRLKCCNTINNLKGVCFCAIWPCIYVIVLPSSSVKHCLTSQECCERATRALRALSVNQYAALSPPHDVASADSLCTSTLFLFTIVVDPALITLHRFN